MTCEQVRQILAAYRVGDVSGAERTRIASHLLACESCRKRFAEYHLVGDYLRTLPLIVPPPELRRRVAAGLKAERFAWYTGHYPATQRSPRYVARLALLIGAPAATGLAALILIVVLLLQMLPGVAPTNLKRTVQAIGTGSPLTILSAAQPHPDVYTASPAYPHVTGALAGATNIVYAATDADGAAMLQLLDRATNQSIPLLARPMTQPLSLEARSDGWVLWMQGWPSRISAWKLNATQLPTSAANVTPAVPLTITLVDSTTTSAGAQVAGIDGVAEAGARALIAETRVDGSSQLLMVDLTDPSHPAWTRIVTAAPGHTVAHPAISAGVSTWADEWFENGNVLHSDIWSMQTGSAPQQQTFDGDAFDPMVADGRLYWLESVSGGVPFGPDTDADFRYPSSQIAAQFHGWQAALDANVAGTIMEKDLNSGQLQSLDSTDTIANPEQGDGDLAIWTNSSRIEFFDLATAQHQGLNGFIGDASFVSINDRSVVWTTLTRDGSAHIQVLDIPPSA
jgi:hypothetical protein